MKKILIPVLAILILVFVFQIVSVISGNSYAAALKGNKCKDCYPVCTKFKYTAECGMNPGDPSCCLNWVTQCFDVPCGSAYNIPPQN